MKMPCTWSALEAGGISGTVPLASCLIKYRLPLVCMVQAGFKSTQRDAWIQDTSNIYISAVAMLTYETHQTVLQLWSLLEKGSR